MEVSDLAERIIHDINVALSREPNMDEFDIIPVLDSQNKSPVIHVGTKMALESWCVKFLYLHVYTRLMEWRERRLKAENHKVVQWSELLLLLNPHMTTGWNIRKELLTQDIVCALKDFRISKLILTRKPKSSEVFIHRRWVIRRLLESDEWLSSSQAVKELLVHDDLQLCTEAATRYPNNYCAWCHREWIHDHVTLKHLSMQVLLNELKFSEAFVQSHVSDHSGIQFRQYLLRTISGVGNSRRLESELSTSDSCHSNECSPVKSTVQFSSDHAPGDAVIIPISVDVAQQRLHHELKFVRNLIVNFPGHEALWYHSRFVLDRLLGERVPGSVEERDESSSSTIALRNGPLVKKTRTEMSEHQSTFLSTSMVDRLINGSSISGSALIRDELEFLAEIQTDDVQQRLVTNHKRWLALKFALDSQYLVKM